jgi:hypothetical protein
MTGGSKVRDLLKFFLIRVVRFFLRLFYFLFNNFPSNQIRFAKLAFRNQIGTMYDAPLSPRHPFFITNHAMLSGLLIFIFTCI